MELAGTSSQGGGGSLYVCMCVCITLISQGFLAASQCRYYPFSNSSVFLKDFTFVLESADLIIPQQKEIFCITSP